MKQIICLPFYFLATPLVSLALTTIPIESSYQGVYLTLLFGGDPDRPSSTAFMHQEDSGLYFSTEYPIDSVEIPEPDVAFSVVSLPLKYIKNTGTALVPMTDAERAIVDAAESAAQAQVEAQRQSDKPLEQRQYENAFFALTEQVLTLSSDPRVGQTPPVKLGFDELNALLESLFDSDMATATKLSIKLLSIDSALKRYNTLWWDDAITHEIPEE